jgi:phage N-6-adenine-methyltransferase
VISSHPAAELFPFMSDEELNELAADIRAHGLLEPIVLLDGLVLDGRNRLRACEAAGVEPSFVEWDGSGDPLAWVISKNLKRRHLDASQRSMVADKRRRYYAEAAKERQTGRPAFSENKLPQICGNLGEVPAKSRNDRTSAAAAARDFNVSPRSVEHAATVVDHGVPELVAAVERGAVAVSAAAEATQFEPEDQRRVVELVEAGASGAEAIREIKRPHVANNSGDNEWYTPPEFIEAARLVMGGIDLDPASSEVANRTVGAERIYTAADDGLTLKWEGRVWMNPPYEKGLIDRFAEKLRDEVKAGAVSEAVVLVNNATDTRWFATLCEVASMVCFPTGRIRFHKPDGERGAPLQGQAVIYIGGQHEGFARAFASFGMVAKVVAKVVDG